MMEALKLCGNSALLLWKLKMIMHAMEQQRVFIGCDRPRLKTEKVGCGSETRCQVDHPQVPAIGNRHSHTATRRLQQIRPGDRRDGEEARSEEHTSELQSPDHLVCRLLLEKKKKKTNNRAHTNQHTIDDRRP